jgi:tRNA (Thr-GGU) A37 N-methylase
MWRNSQPKWVLAIAFFLFSIVAKNDMALGQTKSKIDLSRMQRDLEIMEGVLNKLIAPSATMFGPWGIKTRGLYFEGYGVVFQTDYGGYQIRILSSGNTIRRLKKTEKKLLELKSHLKGGTPAPSGTETELEENEEALSVAEQIQALKAQIVEFLANYADAIGQLVDSDRITVLINLDNGSWSFPFINRYQQTDEEQISILEATAKKSDLMAYRRGEISEDTFEKRVIFNERPQNEARAKNLDIMANIMDTALSKKYLKEFGVEGNTHAVYLEGLGALFFIKGDLNRSAFVPEIQIYIDEYLEKQEVKTIRKGREQRSKKQIRELLTTFQNTLLEVVGDYSHTLRTLKPTDYVVVSVDLDHGLSHRESIPSRFVMRVQKKALDSFNRGNIKLSELRERVRFVEY